MLRTKGGCQIIQAGCILQDKVLLFKYLRQTFLQGECQCVLAVLDLLFPQGNDEVILTAQINDDLYPVAVEVRMFAQICSNLRMNIQITSKRFLGEHDVVKECKKIFNLFEPL